MRQLVSARNCDRYKGSASVSPPSSYIAQIREYMTEHELKDFLDHMIITRISRRVISRMCLFGLYLLRTYCT